MVCRRNLPLDFFLRFSGKTIEMIRQIPYVLYILVDQRISRKQNQHIQTIYLS